MDGRWIGRRSCLTGYRVASLTVAVDGVVMLCSKFCFIPFFFFFFFLRLFCLLRHITGERGVLLGSFILLFSLSLSFCHPLSDLSTSISSFLVRRHLPPDCIVLPVSVHEPNFSSGFVPHNSYCNSTLLANPHTLDIIHSVTCFWYTKQTLLSSSHEFESILRASCRVVNILLLLLLPRLTTLRRPHTHDPPSIKLLFVLSPHGRIAC